jgi:hypothetical protein
MHVVLFFAWPKPRRLASKVSSERAEPILKGCSLFETASSLHGNAPFARGYGQKPDAPATGHMVNIDQSAKS